MDDDYCGRSTSPKVPEVCRLTAVAAKRALHIGRLWEGRAESSRSAFDLVSVIHDQLADFP